jgi:uncharacterized Zn-binding protein involved in type VI secretion
MPGFVVHFGAKMNCTHQAPVNIAATQPRVLVDKKPVALMGDPMLVTGCPFQIPTPAGAPKPQPCVSVKWAMPSTRVLVNGLPVMLQTLPGPGPGAGSCLSVENIAQGPPAVETLQFRVVAS